MLHLASKRLKISTQINTESRDALLLSQDLRFRSHVNRIAVSYIQHHLQAPAASQLQLLTDAMTQITGLLFIAAWTSLAQARNETIVHGWQPEPSGRGTWSIVWSCLTTILLCTWSALHLPVPDWSAVHSDIQSWLPGGTPEHYDTWYVN